MKYFFLSDGWLIGRIWELGGLWNETAWRRKPEIEQTTLCIWENDEKLWLYRVEDAILMVEVKPSLEIAATIPNPAIGQVVLKRLITADQAIEIICKSTGLNSAS
ncbi:MAG: hypothetical protein LH660_09090 [Phormidesmis sp. CAN_BIN36]|nr:hypothetical protein [Phormidesmis sp. CAN_BIN36]